MQVVININDIVYKNIMIDNGWSGAELAKIIKSGTPLPKGHGRLIDADKLQAEMKKDIRRAMSFVDLTDFVWLAPTIIEAEKTKEQ